ncbi:MAG: Gfo/Idh/MocA family oxidoreductase [Candidatus Melainabacteria bacterium]
MTKPLKLGMIGESAGNGHPYSWSAIFNGYDAALMADCPYPVIPAYLAEQEFPACAIQDAAVTHIWTQDRRQSERIAAATRIPHVLTNPEDMVGAVDAVLLARDDAETHYALSKPFLEAGLPVYIDKPIAYDVGTLKKIRGLARNEGQIFTCSALRFARELMLDETTRARLGPIRRVAAQTPKDWRKYAIHLIEPVLQMLAQDAIEDHHRECAGDTQTLEVAWRSGVVTRFTTLGAITAPMTFHITGERAETVLTFTDTFSAFRSALQAFTDTITGRRTADDAALVTQSIELLELGCDD